MKFVDLKYIESTCSGFRNFQKKGKSWNFSCPLCMDSKKDSRKARGYILYNKEKLYYYCHNCGVSLSFEKFLKEINPSAYREYCFEQFKIDKQKDEMAAFEEQPIPTFVNLSIFSSLTKISELPSSHPIKEFVEFRKIPEKYYTKLYGCEKFKSWTNTIIAKKFEEKSLFYDEARLVIPFIDQNKNIIGYQGRAIGNSSVRYISIHLAREKDLIFGLDSINFTKPVYILEGPIDSMFIPNSVAMGGLKISKHFPKDQVILIFDNERRNQYVVAKLEQAINEEYKVVIWPKDFLYKDVNEAIMNNYSTEDIMHLIEENTVSGLQAKLNLGMWK
jgi:hypothetical protein